MSPEFSRCIYLVYSNPLPGREVDLHAWYEEQHIPDSFELGAFRRVRRYRACDPSSRARFLTIWIADYPDLAAAQNAVRPVAEALAARGRIEVYQQVVFQQFLFLQGVDRERAADSESLVTLHNCWARPDSAQRFEAWLPEARTAWAGRAAAARYAQSTVQYAQHPALDASASTKVAREGKRMLVLLEGELSSPEFKRAFEGAAELNLPPFGSPTPMYVRGSPAPSPRQDPVPADDQLASWRPAWAAHWQLISSRFHSPSSPGS